MSEYERLTSYMQVGNKVVQIVPQRKQRIQAYIDRLFDLEDKIEGGELISKEQFEQLQAENAELRARLDKAVELPCKIGDKVYMPWVYDGISGIAEITAMSITIFDGEFICDTDLESDDINFKQKYSYGQFRDFDFGTNVFTTREVAEARLSELKGGKE